MGEKSSFVEEMRRIDSDGTRLQQATLLGDVKMLNGDGRVKRPASVKDGQSLSNAEVRRSGNQVRRLASAKHGSNSTTETLKNDLSIGDTEELFASEKVDLRMMATSWKDPRYVESFAGRVVCLLLCYCRYVQFLGYLIAFFMLLRCIMLD
jgi:hypothetical protein